MKKSVKKFNGIEVKNANTVKGGKNNSNYTIHASTSEEPEKASFLDITSY